MRQELKEGKKSRISKKLEFVSQMYDLAFQTSDVPKSVKGLKKKLIFEADEKSLVECCKKIAQQIKDFENEAQKSLDIVYVNLSKRLREVFKQVVNVIKEEFRTLRTRNNRLPQLENSDLLSD